MSATPVPWTEFSQDPRRPESAGLRASDRDRDVVHGVLVEGYAEGRLSREEYDDRSGRTAAARTLGELPALILDLVPDRSVAQPADLHAEAEARWRSKRRQAVSAMLMPSVICWLIWVVTGLQSNGTGFDVNFPWPLFVMLGTGAHLLRVLMGHQDIVAEEQRRLEKKQRRTLGDPLGGSGGDS